MKHPARLSRGRPLPRALALSVAFALTGAGSIGAFANAERPLSAIEVWRRAPISFERNDGQFRPDVLFVARGIAGDLAIRRGELFVASPRPLIKDGRKILASAPPTGLHLRLNGANESAHAEGRERQATLAHYYQGAARRENVPRYGEVLVKDVYPDIDLALHGREGELEYDFIVAPGADPKRIRVGVEAHQVSIDPQGNLVMRVGDETLRQHAPIAYQQRGGERIPVDARFELQASEDQAEAVFVLGQYDASLPLVIDPVLSYSTYLGGSAADFGGYMAVDASGKVYIAHTVAPNSVSAMDSHSAVVVTKLDPATNTIVYSTTLNGSSYDIVQGLAIGGVSAAAAGAVAYIGGYTNSPDFPTCFSVTDCAARGLLEDAFVSVLDVNGAVAHSRYLGGPGNEAVAGITVDGAGNVYVTGDTDDVFPTTVGAPYPTRVGVTPAGNSDAFVTMFNPNLQILYSTYLGSSGGFDYGTAIAVDGASNMYVTGHAGGPDFPLLNAFQTTPPGMFVTKLNAFNPATSGTTSGMLSYSSFLGGSADSSNAIIVDPATSEAIVAGYTLNTPFTTVNSMQAFGGGTFDGFVSRVSSTGGSLTFSSFLGGSGADFINDVAIGPDGDLFVTGSTSNSDFPLVSAWQNTHPPGTSAFVSRIHNNALSFSTYLGGSATFGNSIVVDAGGSAWVAGVTSGFSSFPMVNPIRAVRQGSSDLFVSKFDFNVAARRADFNGDSKGDAFFRHTDGSNYVWHINGASIVSGSLAIGSQGPLPSVDPSWFVAGIGDFNGDGKADILWRNASGTNYVWHIDGADLSTGLLRIVSQGLLPTVDSTWSVAGIGDFNGDGKSDILWRKNDGTNYVWHVNGSVISGGLLQISSQGLLPGVDTTWDVAGIGDYNGDGKSDILWRRNDGTNYVWHIDGATITGGMLTIPSQGLLPGVDTSWSVMGTADYNGDGKADVFWRRNDGTNYVWHVNGAVISGGLLSIPSQGLLPSVDTSWTPSGQGDYNGDGKGDIFWRRNDGTNYVWHIDGATITGGMLSITSQGLLPSVDPAWTLINPK